MTSPSAAPVQVVILAPAATAQALADQCVAAGYAARVVEGAYAAAGAILSAERAVLVVEFSSPQFLQTGLLALAARRAIPVLKAASPEAVVGQLLRIVPVEEDVCETDAVEDQPQAPPSESAKPTAAGPTEILTREELDALLGNDQ